ncbi:MAG TPA: tRNA pseudouridine(55) synthase TruB [Dermatophilaceae bacterium]|nr:tRNA pseudouridine(55) synthase TruB [Dermatophilaceae bacterium]
MPDGLLILDKPAGWTSHDVVARCRRLCGTRRVGHAGTLDPMATGVLVVGVGRGTRLLTFLVGCDKSYRATIRLGQSTLTDDAQGQLTARYAVEQLADEAVADAVAGLTGSIEQVPSAVSAIKVAGQRSYARVRAGQQVALVARPVTVHRFAVLAQSRVDLPDGPVLDVDVEVDVSSGTYVRALARDLGAALRVGGHLTALRRTRVGSFDVAAAVPLDRLAAGDGIPVMPLAQAARTVLPARELDEAQARAVGHGQQVPSGAARAPAVAAFDPDGRLVAVLDESGPVARSLAVFAPGTGTARG